jgi:hypothetical protein
MNNTTAFLLIAWSLLVSSSIAAEVEYRLSGTVTSVAGELTSEYSEGEIVTARVTVSGVPFQVAGSEIAYYGLSNFTAKIGNYPLTATGGILTILNDWAGGYDAVKFEITNHAGLAGPSVGTHSPEYFSLVLSYDNDLTSLDLRPQFAPATSLYTAGLRFDRRDDWSVQFTVGDFSVIPEPSISVLALSTFACWALGAGSLRCRN